VSPAILPDITSFQEHGNFGETAVEAMGDSAHFIIINSAYIAVRRKLEKPD
jgi:hypothetical protein